MADNYINKTDAKDIVLHFYKMKNWRPDANMGRSINTVKAMLRNGHAKDDIIAVIDYTFEHTNIDIYSIGYFNHVINETLDKIKKEKARAVAKAPTPKPTLPSPKEGDDDSSERNKAKLSRRNSQSNVGKKYNFDMFEG